MTVTTSKEFAPSVPVSALAGVFVGGVSAALMVGALIFQYVWGYAPCEMCIWQRWPHGASILFGLVGGGLVAMRAAPVSLSRTLAYLAIAGIAISGAIGIFHAGVEWKLWPGPPACTGFGYVPGQEAFGGAFQIVRCDEAQWRGLGISLAGYNAIISLVAAALALTWLRRKA